MASPSEHQVKSGNAHPTGRNFGLANIAIDLALDAGPGYSLALLLRDILAAGVPPSAARLPMTPEEVAAGYQSCNPGAADDGLPDSPGITS